MTLRHPRCPTAIRWVLLAASPLLVAQAAAAAELRGRVVGITDGDTLTLLTDRREQVRVRLSDIDTPERGQPYGDRARRALSDLAFGKAVRVVVRDTDRYSRTVGRVFAGAQDVNAEMVRRGAAWVYPGATAMIPPCCGWNRPPGPSGAACGRVARGPARPALGVAESG